MPQISIFKGIFSVMSFILLSQNGDCIDENIAHYVYKLYVCMQVLAIYPYTNLEGNSLMLAWVQWKEE